MSKETDMEASHSPQPSDLVFPPQAAFSWTLRWARAHRSERARPATRTYRIAGSAASDEELAAAVAFCNRYGASLKRD
jgi:hypothetical protein